MGWAGRGERTALRAVAGGRVRADQDRVAETNSLLFQAVEQAASPHEFCGEHAKPKKDDQPAGTGSHNHHSPQRKKSETKKNLQPPLSLLYGLNQHREYPVC